MKTRKIIVYKPNVNFTHHKSEVEQLPPIQESKRLGGRGISSLAKKESDIVVRDIYDYFEVKPPAPPKEKSAGIKPGYIVGIIAIALAICFDLILLSWLEPDTTVATTAGKSKIDILLTKWEDRGYQGIEHRRLGLNEIYTHNITSDHDFVLISSPAFMYKDNQAMINEVQMDGDDFVKYKETIKISLNEPFSFSVRSLSNNTEVYVLYKTSNGIDPLKSLVEWVATISQGVSSLANSAVRVILVIILIILFVAELRIIKLALSGKADKPLRPRGSKPEPSILEKLFGPKKVAAKCRS